MHKSENGIYFFLGNITSHISHALPLYERTGGTFVVLSNRAKKQLEVYGVPVLVLDDAPIKLMRVGRIIKPIHEYLKIDKKALNTVTYLNRHAKVVIFYELYDFEPNVRPSVPKTVFLTHGNMIKNYMANADRLRVAQQYDYMAGLGPFMKEQFIHSGIDKTHLIDIGIARTDNILRDTVRITREVQELLPAKSKPVIAYLPTFWGASSVHNTGFDIVSNIPDSYTLLFRPHPQTPHKIVKRYERIIATRPNVVLALQSQHPAISSLDIMNAAEVIIGDVSSLMLEAILSSKPLVFAYDRDNMDEQEEDYRSIRSIVDNSAMVTDAKSIRMAIDAAFSRPIDTVMWKEAKQRLFFQPNGGATTAIASFVRRLSEEN